MKEIAKLFTFTKLDSKGEPRLVACINGELFINAKWLARESKLSVDNLDLLVGSEINATFYVTGENMAREEEEEKLCTTDNTIVKAISIKPSIALTVARMYCKVA